MRFFYCKTLKRAWSIADTPYPKGAHHLPAILSQEEVAQLIQAAGTRKLTLHSAYGFQVCQNIITIAGDMRREWLDRENYEFGAV